MCANEVKEMHVEPTQPLPVSPAGGPVVACKLDEACVQVDCGELADAMAEVMDESRDAPEYLLHYCGVDYLKQDEPKKPKP